MARTASRRFGFVKLPGKSKRWRNESNPDFPILVTDGLCSGDESILRQLGELRDGITKAGDLTRWLAQACLTEFRIVFRLRGVW
jgi:hypothetical protein